MYRMDLSHQRDEGSDRYNKMKTATTFLTTRRHTVTRCINDGTLGTRALRGFVAFAGKNDACQQFEIIIEYTTLLFERSITLVSYRVTLIFVHSRSRVDLESHKRRLSVT